MLLRRKLEEHFELLREGPAPTRPPFVRKNGEVLEPLLLALPLDLWRSITPYLKGHEIMRLTLIGSPLLVDVLQRRGAVKSLCLDKFISNLNTRLTRFSLIGSFPKLVKFVFQPPSALRLGALDWKVDMLPPTLTHLHVEFEHPVISFLRSTRVDLLNASISFDYMAGIKWIGPTPASPWLPLADLFPDLKHLGIIGKHKHNVQMTESFLQVLPTAALEILNVNFLWLRPASSESEDAYYKNLWSSLPHVTSIQCYVLGHPLRLSVPHRITSLHVTGRSLSFEDVEPLSWLLELRVERMMLPGYTTEGAWGKLVEKLPRGLELLHSANFFPYDWTGSYGAEVVKAMPRTLTSWRSISFPSKFLKHLPRSLKELYYERHIDLKAHGADLPRGIHTLHVSGFSYLDAECVALLPPSLTDLSVQLGTFSDAWIPQLLPNIRSIYAYTWEMTGLLLRPDTQYINDSVLRQSAANCPIIKKCADITPSSKLLYLPRALVSLENRALSTLIPYSSLPRSVTSLPKSYAITDDGTQDLRDLPQGLNRLTIDGNMRFSSWVKLPKHYPNGNSSTIVLEGEDVRNGLQLIAAKAAERNTADLSIYVPFSILHALLDAGSPYAEYNKILTRTCYALWEPQHFALLPESLKSFALSLPSQQLDKPWLSSKTEESTSNSANEALEASINLPPSLTSLSVSAPYDPTKNYYTVSPLHPPPHVVTSTASTLAQSHLSLATLPESLTNLEIHGRVDIAELSNIARFKSLTSLTLGLILGAEPAHFADAESYAHLLSKLPPSLQKLRIEYLPAALKKMGALPRTLQELSIESSGVHYSAAALSALPPNLTKLRISAIDLPKDYSSMLPASLTETDLAWGRRVKTKK